MSSLPLKRCTAESQEGLTSGPGSVSVSSSGSSSGRRVIQILTPTAATTTATIPTPQSSGRDDWDSSYMKMKLSKRRCSRGGAQPVKVVANGRDAKKKEEEEDRPPEALKSQNPIELNANKAADKKNIPITVTITDVDLFDCPICFEYFDGHVYQCENGHIACGSCCQKINNTCPSCSCPTGHIRCLAIEKILEASQISCKNVVYGCEDVMKYLDKHVHERLCIYSPCSCPITECDFVDSVWNFFKHFDRNHLATSFRLNCPVTVCLERNQRFVFLKEELSNSIFVVNQFGVGQGRAMNVVRIAPELLIWKYDYEVKLKDGDSSLTLQSTVENVPNLCDYRCTKHFLVVDDFVGNVECVRLDICIKPCKN